MTSLRLPLFVVFFVFAFFLGGSDATPVTEGALLRRITGSVDGTVGLGNNVSASLQGLGEFAATQLQVIRKY